MQRSRRYRRSSTSSVRSSITSSAGLTNAIDELREYARGIHPAILAEGGLEQALRAVARRSGVPVELDVQTSGRLPSPVEVAAYYVVSEALTNAAKHAEASVVVVDVEEVRRHFAYLGP